MVLKKCTKCMTYTKKGQKLSEARVVVAGESVSLYFKGYNLRDIRYQGRVDFYDKQAGLVIAVCELLVKRNPGYPKTPEPWMAECKILEVHRVVQRQSDIRADVSLMINFHSVQHGSFSGMIRNLSAGGFYMTTMQHLHRGEVITFYYSFRTLERPFSAVVLRGERLPNGSYGYGLRFRQMSDGAESAIRGFVYRKLEENAKNANA